MVSKINPKPASDFYVSRCDVFVHPAVLNRGLIAGIQRLEKRTGMQVVVSAGEPAKLVRKS